MSNTTNVCIQLIILISNIIYLHLTIAVSQCELSSAINLQMATYIHSFILRVETMNSSEEMNNIKLNKTLKRNVRVREIIKNSIDNHYPDQIKMNDIIIIRINHDNTKLFDNSCWNLLRLSTIDIIVFLNKTNTNEFDLYYPPTESTLRVRENIDAVLNYGEYLFNM